MDPVTPGVVWASGYVPAVGYMSTDNFQSENRPLGRNGTFVHDQVPAVFLYSYDPDSDRTGIYFSTNPQANPPVWTKWADGPSDLSYSAFGVGRWTSSAGVGSYLYVCPPGSKGIWAGLPGLHHVHAFERAC